MKIVINSQQEIHGLSQSQRGVLKDALTFDNPAYKNAKKYGRSRYISIPPYLTYYGEHSVRSDDGERRKVMTVPIGVDLSSLIDDSTIIEDQRRSVPVKYPPFNLTLREDQKRAEKAYLSQQDSYCPQSLVQLPTGKGKSILALHIAATLGQKTLILVHKDDLVVSWKSDVQDCFPNMKIGLLKAKSRTIGDQITIATVQTLSRMSAEELEHLTQQFGLVVQDECHHIGLNIFNVIGQFNSRYKLGLTATPKRSDGLSFVFDVFLGGVCYTHTVTEDDSDISQVEVRTIISPARYKPFVFDGQVFNVYDFKKEDLPDHFEYVEEIPYERRPRIPYLTVDNVAVTSEDTLNVVCDKIVEEYKAGHSVIALFTQKEHIRLYHQHLCQVIPEDQIILYYGDSTESSAEMMRRAEEREALVTLATYAKAVEGTNVKSWEVEFLVSSRNNEKDIEQATGRVRRRKEGKLDPVRVYDVVYPSCYTLRNHFDTHMKVYKALKYLVVDTPKPAVKRKSMFSRGYR